VSVLCFLGVVAGTQVEKREAKQVGQPKWHWWTTRTPWTRRFTTRRWHPNTTVAGTTGRWRPRTTVAGTTGRWRPRTTVAGTTVPVTVVRTTGRWHPRTTVAGTTERWRPRTTVAGTTGRWRPRTTVAGTTRRWHPRTTPYWPETTWRPEPTTYAPTPTTDRPDPQPRFDHVRRLHNMEFQFESLSRNVVKILQLIQKVPAIKGIGEILTDVQQITQIKKILTGAVIRFPTPVYEDENGVNYYVQGHVEILHNNRWGTICDDSFFRNYGDMNANVLCRMGGYKGGAYDHGRYVQPYSKKASQIWLDEVYCHTGKEDSIGNCEMRQEWGQHDCRHREDVGIRCYI